MEPIIVGSDGPPRNYTVTFADNGDGSLERWSVRARNVQEVERWVAEPLTAGRTKGTLVSIEEEDGPQEGSIHLTRGIDY